MVGIGPQAQAVVEEFSTGDPEEFLFSPKRMTEERRAALRSLRKSKVQPSQRSRAKSKPKKQPGERYTHRAYDHAVAKGCKKAGIARWHPNQIRHTYATEVRRRFGLEAAQVGLGHSRADVTQVYAERDQTLLVRIASEIG